MARSPDREITMQVRLISNGFVFTAPSGQEIYCADEAELVRKTERHVRSWARTQSAYLNKGNES